jgi:hypothetical protein
MMLQLDPLVPVLVKHKGEWVKGMAHVLIDYGFEHHLIWVTFLDANGECWSVPNSDVRIQFNPTAGRHPPKPKPIETGLGETFGYS